MERRLALATLLCAVLCYVLPRHVDVSNYEEQEELVTGTVICQVSFVAGLSVVIGSG